MNDKQLAKLVKQNAAKAEKLAKSRQGRAYDPTLAATQKPDEDLADTVETTRLFKEMKRREF
jgi:hypothetical protein